jgi:RHS repeat-associated protein
VATAISHFAGPEATAPSWSGEVSGKWERNITGIDGNLVAVQHEGETPVLQIANLHGDIVATALLSETATELASKSGTTEFGVPRTSVPPKYSWLGAHRLPTLLPSGVTTMGLRSYVPQLGRFLQTDPVPGGSTNSYGYTHGDPVDESDLTGQYDITLSAVIAAAISQEGAATAARVAAEEAAARAEAEAAARAALAEAAAYSDLGAEGEEWEEAEEAEGEEGEEVYVSSSKSNEGGKQFKDDFSVTNGLFYSQSVGSNKNLPLEAENFESKYVIGGGPCKYQRRRKCSGGGRYGDGRDHPGALADTYCGVVGVAALIPGVDLFGLPIEAACAAYGGYLAGSHIAHGR